MQSDRPVIQDNDRISSSDSTAPAAAEVLIPECERLLTKLRGLRVSHSDEVDEQKILACETQLKKVIEQFYHPDLIISQRVALALCVLDILEEQPELYSSDTSQVALFKKNVTGFLQTVCNVNEILPGMRAQLKKLLQIDPYYLPNHLPPFLAPPCEGQSRKEYLHKRIQDFLVARQNGLVLTLVEGQLWSEAISKEALTFFRSGKQESWSTRKLSDVEQSLFDTYEYLHNELNEESTRELDEVQYLDVRARDALRIFIANGRLNRVVFHPDNRSQPFEIQAASTQELISHDKKGMACFVMNCRGEMYISSHVENKFHHSSFMSGGDLIFSGEIRINGNGQVEEITAYSGHYQPDIKAMYRCYAMLKHRGLDLSHCIFSLLDNKAMAREFQKRCMLDRGFEAKVKANDPSVGPILTSITNKSMKRLTESDLLAAMKVSSKVQRSQMS
ncbi:hypothetical protein AQUSIP_16080 [Aquicella siphonis]|uniref:Uncharacterized protein n=1 Tax=Aquicella siphonis TaxID=254247 RepID=A0A5E4PH38_9COXI|nr:hypothetical protein [Aquicella siphonis]VVC76299.1 hypothetical protein AQUSIP_16080 [Aquicella siphonis]